MAVAYRLICASLETLAGTILGLYLMCALAYKKRVHKKLVYRIYLMSKLILSLSLSLSYQCTVHFVTITIING